MSTESETSTTVETSAAGARSADATSVSDQHHASGSEHDWQRGQRVLSALKHAARAARLDAEVARLEYALLQATRGEASHLKRLLEHYDHLTPQAEPTAGLAGADAPLDHAAPPRTGHGEPASPTPSLPASLEQTPGSSENARDSATARQQSLTSAGSGWQPFVEFARQRLAHRAQRLITQRQLITSTEPRSIDPLLDGLTESRLTAELADVRAEGSLPDSSAPHRDTAPTAESLVSSDDTIRESQEPNTLAFDLGVSKQSYAQSVRLNRPMLRGMGLSLVAHALALLGLLTVTLRLPRESASLGSQVVSVQAASEPLESSPNLAVPEPLELEMPLAASSQSAAAPSSLDIDLVSSMPQSLSLASATPSPIGPAGLPAATSAPRGADRRANAAAGRALPNSTSSSGKFFGAGAGGNYFCYVVDSSGSMRGRAWESAKLELMRSLTTLAPTQRFYIVFFAQSVSALPEPGGSQPAQSGLVASPENIDHARRWIDSVKLDRGGPPNEALQLAIEREPDAIYLLTDGVTQADVCGFLRKINRVSDVVSGEQVRVPIHTIAYHSLDGQQLLRQLARENAGEFHYVPAK